MNKMVTLKFVNYAVFPEKIVIECDDPSVEFIIQWYEGSHEGDEYNIFVDGVFRMRKG